MYCQPARRIGHAAATEQSDKLASPHVAPQAEWPNPTTSSRANNVVVRYSKEGRRMTELGVRRDKAALSSGCKSHPATAPAGSNRSSHGGNEMAEAFG